MHYIRLRCIPTLQDTGIKKNTVSPGFNPWAFFCHKTLDSGSQQQQRLYFLQLLKKTTVYYSG